MISGCGFSKINTQHTGVTVPSSTDLNITSTPSSANDEERTPGTPSHTDLPMKSDLSEIAKKLEQFGYSINIKNYDIENTKERYFLHVGFTDPHTIPRCLQYVGSYLVDVEEAKQKEVYYEIESSSLIPEQFEKDLLKISEDGTKVLLLSYDSGIYSLTVFDFIKGKTLYRYESVQEINKWHTCASPNLDYLLFYSEGKSYFVEINNNAERIVPIGPSDLISTDGKRAACIEYDSENRYLRIYNILTGELIESIGFGDRKIYLSQWHSSDKILLYTFEGSYIYNLNTKEIQMIGEYLYEPLMSPDGRYIAFCRHADAGWFYPLYNRKHWLCKDIGYQEGLYVKDLTTNEIVQLNPLFYVYGFPPYYFKQVPVSWVYVSNNFDNEQYRACTTIDTDDALYRILASSIKLGGNYVPENVLDGDISTVWVENEEGYNEDEKNDSYDEDPYPGEGLGEWITIYSVEEVDLNSVSTIRQFYYLKPMKLSGIRLINGYAKSKEIYAANNRVKKAEVILHDGTSFVFDLKDNTMGFQTLDFCREVTTKSITIKILDVYKGNKFNDTCISEIELITD